MVGLYVFCKYGYLLTAIENTAINYYFLLAVHSKPINLFECYTWGFSVISVNTIFCQQVPLNAHLLDLVPVVLSLAHACFELLSFRRQAPPLELVSVNWKVRVNIFPSGLFIAAHPALSWCLILSGSRRRLPIVRSHDHPPAKVRRWMGFKGLQETWVRPPCLLVSSAPLSEKTPSVSPCQSSAGCRSHTFQPDLFTSKAKPFGLGWDIPTFGPVLLLQSVFQNWGVKDHLLSQ